VPRPADADSASVAALHVYPVKSCAGVALARAPLEATGLAHDRQWMVVRPGGRFVTQRELPRLALIGVALEADALVLAAPGRPALRHPLATPAQPRAVVLWRDACTGLDQGEEVARWLSEFIGEPLRLVAFDAAQRRVVDPHYTGSTDFVTQFADGYPLLVIGAASLEDLNARLPVRLPINRFRPNLVLGGVPAYAEDRIHELHAPGIRLRLVKPCTRCSITATDQARGVVDGDEPLHTLHGYRWDRTLHGIAFGQNAVVVAGAGRELVVGQALAIDWKS
jgi:uncharacterized protein YcbX